MHYCKRCNIYVESDRSHCPLCGKCVCPENREHEREYQFYPSYSRWRRERLNLVWLLTLILVIVNIVWVIVEYAVFKEFYYVGYVLPASITAFFTIVLPLGKKQSLMTKSVVGVLVISAFLFFIELYTKSVGWGMSITIPMVLLAYDIGALSIMISRGYYQRSSLYPLLFNAIYATVLFILNVVVKSITLLWPSITALAVSWGFFVILFIFRYRKIVNGIKKDFHI